MALGNVKMTDTDGNINNSTSVSSEKVTGLLFDVSAQTDFWTKGAGLAIASLKDKVLELTSLAEAVKAGITAYTGETGDDGISKDLLAGIPYYHIKHFFDLNSSSGRLFVMFADCSQNWDAIVDMQKAAHGLIYQFGVWTEQSLWKYTDTAATAYSVKLVGTLNSTAKTLADNYNSQVSILLSANTAKVSAPTGTDTKVAFSKIPTCIGSERYVSVLLGQDTDSSVETMQASLASCTPVGCVGAALGCLALASVEESIGYVAKFNLKNYFSGIEFGFGDATLVDKKMTNYTQYESLTRTQLDTLDDNGYIFLCRYEGLEGNVYFSGDQTCSSGDFRTIARNRTIGKSRRGVRKVLLPYVNSPIKVNPSTGYMSTAQCTVFSNLVGAVLSAMQTASEISGYSVSVPATQNVLENDTVNITYAIVPVGEAKEIIVTEGLSTTNASK